MILIVSTTYMPASSVIKCLTWECIVVVMYTEGATQMNRLQVSLAFVEAYA